MLKEQMFFYTRTLSSKSHTNSDQIFRKLKAHIFLQGTVIYVHSDYYKVYPQDHRPSET